MRWLLALILLLAPVISEAQDAAPPRPAVLVADELFVTADRELVARGNVEVFQGPVQMQAREIRYDRVTGALSVTGPIRLQDGESITILADAADLDADLRTGLLTGARIVMDQQLQLTAARVQRVDDRYSQIYKTAVTACNTCEDGRAPLWQIRARRIIHDQQERQLYFDGAQFLIRDVPVFYWPRLRLPDPTVKRASGFLIPSLRSTSEFGVGIKIPYFFALRDDRDLTVTPYISSRTSTLELRYRQAFVNGDIQIDTAVSRDDERPGETRAYLFAEGAFDLQNDFKLEFDIETTSDDAYLQDYGYSDKDRLDSQLLISRARRDDYAAGSLIGYKSLRDNEKNSTIPTIVGDLYYQRRIFPAGTSGELRLTANGHTHIRYSDDDIVGRDVQRFNGEMEWLQGWTLPGGLRGEGSVGLFADLFNITQDSTTNQNQKQLTPFSSFALRYPLSRTLEDGTTDFLEPIAQLSYTAASQLSIPNEESTLVEFDGGNLLSLSRFPGPDRRERGTVGAYGINWSRFAAQDGWESSFTAGQVVRQDKEPDFTQASGLSGLQSDYLVAGQFKTEGGWAVTARSLFDDSLNFAKAEILGSYTYGRGQLTGSYLWLVEDAAEDRFVDTSELYLDGDITLAQNWAAAADWRYDLENTRASNAGLSLVYFNECVEVDFSVRRRFTSSSSLEPSTSLGLSIKLRGFSARAGSEEISRRCG